MSHEMEMEDFIRAKDMQIGALSEELHRERMNSERLEQEIANLYHAAQKSTREEKIKLKVLPQILHGQPITWRVYVVLKLLRLLIWPVSVGEKRGGGAGLGTGARRPRTSSL